jgi:Glycosyltransferase family 87
MFLVWMIALSAISAIASDIYYYTNRFVQCCALADDDPPFSDLWAYKHLFSFFHTTAFFTRPDDRFAYPAFSAVMYDMVYHLGRHAQAVFLTSELIVCGFAAYLFFTKIRRNGLNRFSAAVLVITTLLFSYPLLYMFGSGSVEIFACIFTAAGLWATLKGHDSWAAVWWAAAGAMKIYPLLLLGLFLSRTKYRSVIVGLAAFALISVLSMWFVGPTIPIAFAGSISGVTGFVSTYAQRVKVNELPFDHSLLAPIKIFAYVMAHRTGNLAYLTKPYILIAGAIALLAFFLKATHMPMINQVIFLFAAMIALPPVSYDHTLVHLYAPWAMLVIIALREGAAGVTLPGFRTYFLCFAVLFTSQRFIYYHWIHPNGAFKAVALVTLIVTALRYPIPDQALHEVVPPAPAQPRQFPDVSDAPSVQQI